jgi:glutamyl-tRNA synthetase
VLESKQDMSQVRTRFAPSPTGFLHIGSLRTALYAYALAKHEGGKFVLRIEDTDKEREVAGSTEALQKTLRKFGLVWDEFYTQSERLPLYSNAAKKLVKEGHAFYCQCEPKNAKKEGYSTNLRDLCRDKNLTSGAVKLKVPANRKVSYYDFVHRKEITWETNTVYDATLLKSDGFPTYHLAAMVDDLDMKISHLLRGHDWLPSTPIHLLVFEFLGGKRPEIGHLTDILSATTGKKLSKRKDSVFCEQFLEQGFLPEAILNFIMLLGWAPKDNREVFTLTDFVKNFDINGFQEANPRFLENKLLWFNGYYIREKNDGELAKLLVPFAPKGVDEEGIKKIVPLIKDRLKKLSDFTGFAGFFFVRPEVDRSLLGENYIKHLTAALEAMKKNTPLDQIPEKNGFETGDFFMDLRVAVTGSKFTPPINESIKILGKEETISRINGVLK